MPLDKTQPRMDGLMLAAEGRLFVTDGTDDFSVKSELNDNLTDAQPAIADAASDLRDNGDLEDGDLNSGPEDQTPVVLTPQGAALRDEWSQE